MSSSNSSSNGSQIRKKRRHSSPTTSDSSSKTESKSGSYSAHSSSSTSNNASDSSTEDVEMAEQSSSDDEDNEPWEFNIYVPKNVVDHYHNIQTDLIHNKMTLKDCESAYFDGEQHYCLLQSIGKGAFGTVYRAAEVEGPLITNRFFAIKVFRPFSIQRDSLNREISVVDTLIGNPHNNVIRYREHFKHLSPAYFFVSELATIDLKNLLTVVNNQGQPIWQTLQPQYCRHLIRGVAEGVAHLHSLGIAHGDIKLENIMVTEAPLQEPDPLQHLNTRIMRMTPKLIDFSNSERGEPGEPIMKNQPRCSLYSSAPESWSTNWSSRQWLPLIPYDMIKADVYSVGAVLLSLLLSCYPFVAPDYIPHQRVKKRICILMKSDTNLLKQLVQPFDYTLRKVLLRNLEPKPQNRITIQEFLADEWFTQTMASQEWHYDEKWETTQRKGLPHHQQRRRSIQREFQFKDENQ